VKENTLADDLVKIAIRQLNECYSLKLPRMQRIRKYRDLYNGNTQRQERVRFNIPIAIFAGMIDTLQADLDDVMVIKYGEDDPADWKQALKANAAIQKEQNSALPGAMWANKLRMARQEEIFSGRGFLKLNVGSGEDGFYSNLSAPTFEDMYWEPKGGGQLENHRFCGQSDIFKSQAELEERRGNEYDARQVDKLIKYTGGASGNEYKICSYWQNEDYANRFMSLGLNGNQNNYVGEPMFNFVEWGMTYKGKRWYLLFESFTGTWIRCEKLTDVHSSGLWPWMSMATHEDAKNFASKSFADDLYPYAIAMTSLFNEDLENRKRRNSNARAYDKDMFPNVKKLDEAQAGRDRLVEVDTKMGTRRIEEGIYEFKTAEIKGTVDMLQYMEDMVGRNLGVTDLQQGSTTGSDNKVGITLLESQAVSKRLSFESQPFLEVGQQLGMRYFNGLQDYLHEPLSIKILGEKGYEWDTLKRIDLNIKRNFEITVTSQSKENKKNEIDHAKKITALTTVRNTAPANQNVNARIIDEYLLRDAGLDETEITLILDPRSNADKTTIAETSAAIQDIMQGRTPKTNYNASAYFLQTILDFVKTHQDDKKVARKMDEFMAYIEKHVPIATDNEQRRAAKDAQTMLTGLRQPGQEMPASGQPMVPQGGAPQSPAQPPEAPVALPKQPAFLAA
jgi:hypothetical protein